MKPRTIVLLAVFAAQLAVPLSLVAKHEQTRREGSEWRFQTAPVDPADPFRGRYVRLSFEAERQPVAFADGGYLYTAYDRRMYAELGAGPDGYARLVRLHDQRPAGVEYLDVFTRHMQEPVTPGGPASVFVHLPFDRFYLTEERAPEVERAYFEASRSARDTTYVVVRVRDGHAALVDLVLGGKPVVAN